MHNFTSCVLDTSVIIKALFSPSRRQAGTTYSREVNTHKTCAALLAALDEKGIEGIIPQCGIVEIAAVSSRLADARAAEEICNEVEMSYQLVPEEQIIRTATKIAREEGCPGFDTYFLALAGTEFHSPFYGRCRIIPHLPEEIRTRKPDARSRFGICAALNRATCTAAFSF